MGGPNEREGWVSDCDQEPKVMCLCSGDVHAFQQIVGCDVVAVVIGRQSLTTVKAHPSHHHDAASQLQIQPGAVKLVL